MHALHIPSDALQQDHLLKSFWKHCSSHYFKNIDVEDHRKLNFLQSVFHCYGTYPHLEQLTVKPEIGERFKMDLGLLLTETYSRSRLEGGRLVKEDAVWLKKMLVKCYGGKTKHIGSKLKEKRKKVQMKQKKKNYKTLLR
jgi:hypothetical protein